MIKDIFPKEIIEYSTEHHIWKNTVKSQLVYSSVILFVILIFILLPYIKVDISVPSRGIIRPVIDRDNLTSLVSGKIETLYVRENELVHKGDIVAIVDASDIRSKLSLNKKLREKIRKQIKDLQILTHLDSALVFRKKWSFKLESSVYRRSFIHFYDALLSEKQEIKNKERIFSQNKFLYQKQDISESKYKSSAYSLSRAHNNFNVEFDEQLSQWQIKLEQDQQELDKLKSNLNELQSKIDLYTIRAPVTGTIQNMDGLADGSSVYVNQKLAEISPDTGLIAVCYVQPQNIGLLRKAMKGHFQIDTYNTNQWGTIDGHIDEISNDVSVINNQAVFKVKCKLNRTYLTLDNGFRGYIKKGMTLQGRFIIARTSLFQLLYNHIDVWLNPAMNTNENGKKANI